MAIDATVAPYSVLVSRTRSQFRDQGASPSYDDSAIILAVCEALMEFNVNYATGYTVSADAISPEFDAYSDIATVTVIGAAAIVAGWMLSDANRENLDIRKRGLALSISNQVEQWQRILESLNSKFDHIKKLYFYAQTTGERITYNAVTESVMPSVSTIP